MKSANHNEVDLLLRSFARRTGKPAVQRESGDGSTSDHLDADELNSYAEGVVPAPARARYTEHLAECDSCRGMVVSLSQSSGAASAFNVPEPQTESNFWHKLSAFFSPAVMRFAVPALVLTVVIGIGLFAFRPQREPDFIAQNKTAEITKPEDTATQKDGAVAGASATPLVLLDSSSSTTNADSRLKELDDQKRKVAEAPLGATDSTLAKAPIAKDGLTAGERPNEVAARTYSSEPKAAPPPAPVTVVSEADKGADLAKAAPEKREDQPSSRDAFRMQREEEHGPNRARNSAPMSTGSGAKTGALMSNRGPSDSSKNMMFSGRSVAGRRFIRDDNTWVDTEYDSSRAITIVKRGSEQFRALVADEPGIQTISEQLSGVVIVVWKSRAYRIQ